MHLTAEQRDKIEKIVADGQERNRNLWAIVSPQMRDVIQDTRQHIREVLTPEQQKQFEELLKRAAPPAKFHECAAKFARDKFSVGCADERARKLIFIFPRAARGFFSAIPW